MSFFLIRLYLIVTVVATTFYAAFDFVVPWPLIALSFTYSRGLQLCLEVTIGFQINYAILTFVSCFEFKVSGVPEWICDMNVFLVASLVIISVLLIVFATFLSQGEGRILIR